MLKVLVICDRCFNRIEGLEDAGTATSGFYKVGAGTEWSKYANSGESILCDACMFNDPRYIADYGTRNGLTPDVDQS